MTRPLYIFAPALVISGAIAFATTLYGASNQSTITTQGAQTCISSNGTPTHSIGQFPNRGNPNSFRAQDLKYCFDSNPKKTSKKSTAPISGVTLTGIPIRPGTADWYDASARRGFSRDRSSGWNLDGMAPGNPLGLDSNNAHVDNRGLYHYHGMPTALININGNTLMGYAADGHEIHYVGSNAESSWQLKSGTRPTAPGGAYDGSYNQDWEYVAGSGNLDECNGGLVNGKYVYFATDSYPFFPRCFYGTVSSDFETPGGNAGLRQGDQQLGQNNRRPRDGRKPRRPLFGIF
ncbi:MAG: YHYH protein [Pseudomonadota bacterium]